MRAEGKASCCDSWYLLVGVLLQKHTSLPSKRKASTQPGSHTNGVPDGSYRMSAVASASTRDVLDAASNGQRSNSNSSRTDYQSAQHKQVLRQGS